MKKSKIIIPALAMLVMSTAATVSGTVAWFTINKTVNAKGMTVRAVAESSLVIKGTQDGSFGAIGTNNLVKDNMKPSTSYDGKSFGYLGAGVQVTSAASASATWSGTDGAFQSSDLVKAGADSVYYASTSYTLKSIGSDKTVYVKNITVDGSATAANNKIKPALRCSITCGTNTKVFNIGGGNNQAAGVGKYTDGNPGTWVLAPKTYDAVNSSNASLGSFDADTDYTVAINIWFEGQDTSCYSDNVDGVDYKIAIFFTTDAEGLTA